MASILHGSARTTPRVRAELQASKEKASVLAKRYGLSRTTVNKWRSRSTTADARMGPRDPRSTVLTPAEEAIIVAFRQRTLLPLDDVMGCLREQIPKLTRSSLHRCLERHGISRLPVDETMTKRGRFSETTIGYVHIDGIAKDEAAVRAAITTSWSNGQTEGQVTRLKLVKRQMYGRAKIDLLQARLIGAA